MRASVQPLPGPSMSTKTTPNRNAMPRPCPIGVDVAHRGRLGLGHEDRGQHDRGSADRQVDPEHRAPVDELDERAADDRPERHRDADDAAPDADRPGALHPAGEHLGDDRHRDRVQHRTADRLHECARRSASRCSAPGCTAASRSRRPSARSGTSACARTGRRWRRTAAAATPAPACRCRSTHCSCDGEACRSARMFGMATLTIVASIDTISRLRQQDTRMMPLRRALSDRTTVSFTQLL